MTFKYWRFCYIRIGLFFWTKVNSFPVHFYRNILEPWESWICTALGDDIFGCLNMLGQLWLEQDSKGPKYFGAAFMNLSHSCSLLDIWPIWKGRSIRFLQSFERGILPHSGKIHCHVNWHTSDKGNDDNLELQMISTPEYQVCGKGSLEDCNDDCFAPWPFVPTFLPPLPPPSHPARPYSCLLECGTFLLTWVITVVTKSDICSKHIYQILVKY